MHLCEIQIGVSDGSGSSRKRPRTFCKVWRAENNHFGKGHEACGPNGTPNQIKIKIIIHWHRQISANDKEGHKFALPHLAKISKKKVTAKPTISVARASVPSRLMFGNIHTDGSVCITTQNLKVALNLSQNTSD